MGLGCAVTVLSVQQTCSFLSKGAVFSEPMGLGSDNDRFICVIVHNRSQMSRIMQVMCQDCWGLKSWCSAQILLSQIVLTESCVSSGKLSCFIEETCNIIKEKRILILYVLFLCALEFTIVMWARDAVCCKHALSSTCHRPTFVLFLNPPLCLTLSPPVLLP